MAGYPSLRWPPEKLYDFAYVLLPIAQALYDPQPNGMAKIAKQLGIGDRNGYVCV